MSEVPGLQKLADRARVARILIRSREVSARA